MPDSAAAGKKRRRLKAFLWAKAGMKLKKSAFIYDTLRFIR